MNIDLSVKIHWLTKGDFQHIFWCKSDIGDKNGMLHGGLILTNSAMTGVL